MKYLKLFSNQEIALGEVQTPVVFYLNGAPKPMYAGKEWGDRCTIVIDDTEGSAGIKPKGFTIIFRDDKGNIISEKEYISGETIIIPEAPVKVGYDFIGWGDVIIDKAVTNMIFIAQYEVTPKVTITMNDTYTDGSSIALNATKTETVTGELSFTTDLASDIAHIEDNVLIFDKHYEGTINILASALDKHSNIQSDSKTITVSCDVADTVKCVVSNVTADAVEADATSAIIKYDCNVTTTTHAGVSNTVVAHKEKIVTFEANESKEDVTRSGSFTCEHGETVAWSIQQKGAEVGGSKPGDVLCSDGSIVSPVIASDGYTVESVDLGGKTPVGVCVIPSSHMDDGKARFVSLKGMSLSDPENGGKNYIKWGSYENLPFKNIDIDSSIIFGTKEPNEFMVTFDAKEGLYYKNADNHCPNPFNSDGSRNEEYVTTLGEMDGISYTDVIINAVTADWQTGTISNIISLGNFPAACCCRRYAPNGFAKGEWYLPSLYELGYVVANSKMLFNVITEIGGSIIITSYWSSTPVSGSTEGAYILSILEGTIYGDMREHSNDVIAFLAR